MKTTHQAVVVEVTLEPAPNADSLALARFNGYQVVTNKGGWESSPTYPTIIAVHIPPENEVDSTKDEFKFLHKGDVWAKVSVCKLRGNISEGILIPAPKDAKVGDDLTEYFGVKHIEDDVEPEVGGSVKPAGINLHKYDIDSAKDFYTDLTPEDEVVATLKYHGENTCFLYDKESDKICIRARTTWQTNNAKGSHYKAYLSCKDAVDLALKNNPTYVIWGEAFGGISGFNYGRKGVGFVCFDIWDLVNKRYLNYDEYRGFCAKYGIPVVHEVYRGPFNFDHIKSICDVPSQFSHPNEGIVIKTTTEKVNRKLARMVFKIISPSYKMGKDLDFENMTMGELVTIRQKIDDAIAVLNEERNKQVAIEMEASGWESIGGGGYTPKKGTAWINTPPDFVRVTDAARQVLTEEEFKEFQKIVEDCKSGLNQEARETEAGTP